MAKVSVEVTFDQPERAYHPGDFVTGTVELLARRDLDGLGVRVTTRWETHGSGSRDHGPTIELIDEPGVGVEAQQVRSIPFSFGCPERPFSYRGRRINIDHVVEAEVAVPFGRDQRAQEEFFVNPRLVTAPVVESPADVDLPLPVEQFTRDAVRRMLTSQPGAFLWLLPIFLALQIGFFGGLFLGGPLVVAIAVGWVYLRPELFARVLDDLVVTAGSTSLHPLSRWPVRARFRAKHAFESTGVRVRVIGQEVAIDDSGTTTSTKRHTFHDDVQRFEKRRSFAVGDQFDETFAIMMPDTIAWSFADAHNEVKWEAEFVLEIQGFPDWVLRTPLLLEPQPRAIDAPPARDALPVVETGPPPLSPARVQDTVASELPPVVEPSSVSASDLPVHRGVEDLLLALAALPSTGSARDERVRLDASETISLSVIVDRVVRSMRSSLGDGHRRGQEIVGVLADRDDEVQIFLLASSTERVEGLGRGDRFDCVVHPHGWDGLYQRLIAIEAESA